MGISLPDGLAFESDRQVCAVVASVSASGGLFVLFCFTSSVSGLQVLCKNL